MAEQHVIDTQGMDDQQRREYLLLVDWMKEYRKEQSVYFLAGRLYSSVHLVLGITVIVGSAIAGSSLIAGDCEGNMVTGISALVAGVAGSINTYLKPSAVASQFFSARMKVKLVRLTIERMVETRKWSSAEIKRVNVGLEDFLSEVPSAPKYIWRKIRKRGW